MKTHEVKSKWESAEHLSGLCHRTLRVCVQLSALEQKGSKAEVSSPWLTLFNCSTSNWVVKKTPGEGLKLIRVSHAVKKPIFNPETTVVNIRHITARPMVWAAQRPRELITVLYCFLHNTSFYLKKTWKTICPASLIPVIYRCGRHN